MTRLIEGALAPLKSKRIRVDTCKLFGFKCAKLDTDNHLYIAEYRDVYGQVQCQRITKIEQQFTYWNGPWTGAQLFGQHHCQERSKRLVIAKNEIDAMTISQAFNNSWPVVAIPGYENALPMLKRNLEWLNSHHEIVLAFDSTDAGRQAVDDVGSLFPPGKVKIMRYKEFHDASEMLMENAGDTIAQCVFQAKEFRPDGIVMGSELWDDIIAPPPAGLEIPYPDLNRRLKGLRQGRIYLLTAGSGLGKSTLAHELGYHMLTEHNQKIGIFALEEPRKRLAERYISFALNRPIHLDRTGVTDEELRQAYDRTINNDNFALYDHRGSKDIDSILAKVRFMAVGLSRQWIIFDHISIVVSGLDEIGESERKTIDRLMTGLSSMVEELNIGFIAVVHLKRKGDKGKSYNEGKAVSLSDLRGSGGLEQLSHAVVSMERNQQDEELKNYSKLRLLKDRDAGDTGESDILQYHTDTGRLTACQINPFKQQNFQQYEGEEF